MLLCSSGENFFRLKSVSLNLYDTLVRFVTFSWLLWQFFGPLSKDCRVLDKLFTELISLTPLGFDVRQR